MRYNLSKMPFDTLLRPVSQAGTALARLDERLARSPVGVGVMERAHFTDACASLWVDGELVHLEDLVLHDAGHDIRTPTHELTIARDVLRTRRRIAAQPSDWALGVEGLQRLRGEGGGPVAASALPTQTDAERREKGEEPALLADEFAAIDAALARSEETLATVRSVRAAPRQRDPLVYDPDWDEDTRLAEWRAVLGELDGYPPILQAVIALDAWNALFVLQHAPWLGRLLAAALLRQAGITTAGHLVAFNLGLKAIPVDRRRHRDRDARLQALVHGLVLAAEQGFREHDRLSLARQMMERRLVGRRTSSRLPALVDLVLSRPLVSAGMVAETLAITPRAALRIVEELGLREVTGRGRFRAWGVL